jgi:uncharacterized protein YndB with AHSA1/START domain
MPEFHDTTTTAAPPEEVWKILYDPARFPEWWSGIETVETEASADGETKYTMYPDGYPDFPMPQLLRTDRDGGRVSVSCLVSDLQFEWRLEPLGAGAEGTRISVDVEIPEEERQRLDTQREAISASLGKLAELAAAA